MDTASENEVCNPNTFKNSSTILMSTTSGHAAVYTPKNIMVLDYAQW